MRLSRREFRDWDNKCVTLIGMAGVGKTGVATVLRRYNWFHYSADYRIGTRYLNEPLLDDIKQQAMQIPFLRDLLRSDSIYISNNITVDNLHPVTTFLGTIGDPERGGLSLKEFKRRQALYRQALVAAMLDVPEFTRKAREIYGYKHFVNDTAGSVCEVDCPQMIDVLASHTLILYVRPSEEDAQRLLRTVGEDLRPLCFSEDFLDEQLAAYQQEKSLPYAALMEPGDFYRWVLPRLYRERVLRYEEIASRHGYTVSMREIEGVRDEVDFLNLLESVIERSG